MFISFEKALQQLQKKYILLEGVKKTRIKIANSAINQLISNEN